MDKIKTVKIKELDGSISEETYTISVDARNVDMENSKNLQETIGTINVDIDGNIAEQLKDIKDNKVNIVDIVNNLESDEIQKPLSAKQGKILKTNIDELYDNIDKKTYYYDTVADMKADIKLKAGDMAVTLGYYEPNDGGRSEYRIISSTERYAETLDNNLKAELIIKEEVHPEQFGAYGDGIHDDTEVIEYIISKELKVSGSKVYKVDNLKIGYVEMPEHTPQKIADVFLNKIVSTGTNAVCILGCVNFKFNYIENTVGNGIAFINNTYDSNIHGTRITAKKNGIYFNNDTENGGYRCWVQYVEFNIKQIVAEENALYVYTTDRWFNSNRFIDCVFAGGE